VPLVRDLGRVRSHIILIHSQCLLEFDTQDTGPAYTDERNRALVKTNTHVHTRFILMHTETVNPGSEPVQPLRQAGAAIRGAWTNGEHGCRVCRVTVTFTTISHQPPRQAFHTTCLACR